MIIVCPSCRKKFDVDENLIPEKGRLLKCGSCDQTWFFNKNENVQIKSSAEELINEKKLVLEIRKMPNLYQIFQFTQKKDLN